jgi:hypothetical protein
MFKDLISIDVLALVQRKEHRGFSARAMYMEAIFLDEARIPKPVIQDG